MSLVSYLTWRTLGGVACYVAVMFLAYGTPMRPVRVAGMALLAGGMYLMGRP